MNAITKPPIPEMRRAYQRSDASYDGIFYLAVRTTGVFCRPSCPARKPLPKNVEYFGSTRAALFAGYRPCKRCRPMLSNGQPPVWVAKLLAKVDDEPRRRFSDTEVRKLGIDAARARRYFLKHHGMYLECPIEDFERDSQTAARLWKRSEERRVGKECRL